MEPAGQRPAQRQVPARRRIGNAGRLDGFRNTTHPGFQKFTERNWAIVAELEKVAAELGRSMAQVALNWVATQPGIASVILGATKLAQLQDNLGGAGFHDSRRASGSGSIRSASRRRHSRTPISVPRYRPGVTGGAVTGDKPSGYAPPLLVEGDAVSITSS